MIKAEESLLDFDLCVTLPDSCNKIHVLLLTSLDIKSQQGRLREFSAEQSESKLVMVIAQHSKLPAALSELQML